MHTTESNLEALRARLVRIEDLKSVMGVLMWDQTTYMPNRGAAGRGRQLAALGRLVHEHQSDIALGQLLDALTPLKEDLEPADPTQALLQVARRDFERAVRVPTSFVAQFRQHQAATYEVWKVARPANDFEAVRPMLERTLALSRQQAEFFPGYDSIADPLIADADYGITAAWTREQFALLRSKQLPLLEAVCERSSFPDPSVVEQFFSPEDQLAFGIEVVRELGYDFDRGRQDQTIHPYMVRLGRNDVRITTRIDEHNLGQALFSTIHEAGHALYEQGIDPALDGTPLAHGTSSGVHESQSRLWENLVGRDIGFWLHFYPRLQARFPDQLGHVSVEVFHRDINRVRRSLIRTDADELTYNLHVMLRFELELDLLEGRIEVAQLPEEWGARMEADLGLRPSDDRDGVLQDVHWFGGQIGGEFQGYALGNVMSAQFYEAAVRDRPTIPQEVAHGQFESLLTWLNEHVHHPGRGVPALALVEQATGRPLSVDPYLSYLTKKYSALYGIERLVA